MSKNSKHQTAPDPNQTGWPKGVPYIIGNEGCERFSYYGMKAILMVYIVGLYMNMHGLALADARNSATETIHLWSAAVYSLPLIGAIIADRLLGKYRTILYLSVVYCLGHLALAVFEDPMLQKNILGAVYIDPLQGMFIGLGLIAMGSGGIKPCVSAHVGDQFGKGNWHLLQKVFNAFYFIINFGSAFATILIPMIRGGVIDTEIDGVLYRTYEGSVGWAFGIPGILMAIATFFFWKGRNVFIHVPPTHPGIRGVLDVVAGTFLFLGALAVPIFFGEILGSVMLTTVVSLICIVGFVITYAIRQRIEQDDGFMALTFYALRIRIPYMISCINARFILLGFALVAWVLFSQAGMAPPGAMTDNSMLLWSLTALALTLVGLCAPLQPASTVIIIDKDVGEGEAPPAGQDDHRNHWFYGPAARKFGSQLAEGPMAVWKILSVFLLVSVFWGLFHQHSSTWISQARDMNRVVDMSFNTWLITGALLGFLIGYAFVLTLRKKGSEAWLYSLGGLAIGIALGFLGEMKGPYSLEASQVPAVNPFLVMILIPYTTFGLYPLMEKMGFRPTPLRRMSVGMIMAGAAFAVIAIVQGMMDGTADGELIHVGWQLPPYLIITLAEVMVSITGLEFAYSQAPKRMKSVVMGFWLLLVTIGDLLVVFVTRMQFSPAKGFWIFAVLMVISGLIFAVRARSYKYKEYTQ